MQKVSKIHDKCIVSDFNENIEHLYNKKQSSPHCIPNQNDSFKNFDELNFLTKIGK